MTASQVKDPMPPLPIQLRMCINEAARTSTIVERVLNTHIRECPRRQVETGGECSIGLCQYFTWHLNHYYSCGESQEEGREVAREGEVGRDCESCNRVVSWIDEHRRSCSTDHPCGLLLCSQRKKLSVRDSIKELTLTRTIPVHQPVATATRGEATSPSSTFEHRPPSYASYDTDSLPSETPPSSAGSSPSNTHHFGAVQSDPEASLNCASRWVNLLHKQPSVQNSSDQSPFCRTMSDPGKSLTQSITKQEGYQNICQTGRGGEEEKRNVCPTDSINVTDSLNQSLCHISPKPTSSVTGSSPSSQAQDDRSSSCASCGHIRPGSDSAIGSTCSSENEMSSLESVTLPHQTEDMESISTNSTLQATTGSYNQSGLSSDVHTPVNPRVLEATPGPCVAQQVSPEEAYPTADALLLGRPIFVHNPQAPAEVDATPQAHMDHDWRESHVLRAQQPSYLTPEAQQELQSCYDQYYQSTKASSILPTHNRNDEEAEKEVEESIRRTLDHRASVREYLQGQFYHRQTYREHEHWSRVRQIGHGGQAKCFCIEDNRNKYLLCLKEETENKKTLDETFICLKLAMLVRDTPLNIVEFFGASILPHFDGNNRLQLFLELMPSCLQEYVFQCGPLSPETTLNYSFQLFEALDYLHHRLKIIHCDIKPANLLIDYNFQRLKVADFGCAELLEECRYGSSFPGNKDAGTLWYNPPEFYHDGNCGFGMDIWQAGCSVLYMATGRRPWRCMCMDVNNSRTTGSRAAQMKKTYRTMIGDQSGGHPLPGFLSDGLRQLLSGCLRMKDRLSAKDCVYLTVCSEASNNEQERKVVEKLEYCPSADVLLQLQSQASTEGMVDVYLGKEFHCADIDGVPHAILNGWLGSVPYQKGMTYENLLDLVRQHLPVTQHFGECNLATCENNPQVLWKLIKDKRRHIMVRPDQLVDHTRAFLLLPRDNT